LIETGRWRNIDRENRYCNLCNCQTLGDQYHYVLECSSVNDKRKQLLPKYFMKRHNVVKFFELLSTKKQSLLRKLCIFIKHINKVFCTHCCSLTYVYFVNSLVMLLLCCYFSLYHCIWLYENKDTR
jgi:hypothetical protein